MTRFCPNCKNNVTGFVIVSLIKHRFSSGISHFICPYCKCPIAVLVNHIEGDIHVSVEYDPSFKEVKKKDDF